MKHWACLRGTWLFNGNDNDLCVPRLGWAHSAYIERKQATLLDSAQPNTQRYTSQNNPRIVFETKPNRLTVHINHTWLSEKVILLQSVKTPPPPHPHAYTCTHTHTTQHTTHMHARTLTHTHTHTRMYAQTRTHGVCARAHISTRSSMGKGIVCERYLGLCVADNRWVQCRRERWEKGRNVAHCVYQNTHGPLGNY